MTIWLINHYAVPPKYYPLARQTYFAKYLMEMGHEVKIFAASSVHNSDMNLITDKAPWREETVDGVSYVYVKCCDYQGNGLKRIYNMCEFAQKLPGVCKHFPRPDAIVATSMPPMSCAAGIRLARKYGCVGVAEIADLWPESIVAYGMAGPRHPAVVALRKLEKWIYTKSDAVVFTMEGAYDYIKEQGWEKDIPRSKVHFINNGVDLAPFDRDKEELRIPDADLDDPEIFTVVYAGSIRPANGVGLLLDAAKAVCNPKVKFLIWGDGDERPGLEQRVKDEKIGNVVFKGRVAKKYIPSIVSRAGVNVLNYEANIASIFRYGSSQNKLFEYFAGGHPVLANVRINYNLIDRYGAGISLDSPTPEAIAQAVEKLAGAPENVYQAYCENARRAARDYDFRKLTQKLLNVINNPNGEEE